MHVLNIFTSNTHIGNHVITNIVSPAAASSTYQDGTFRYTSGGTLKPIGKRDVLYKYFPEINAPVL